MLLRVSGQQNKETYDINAIRDPSIDSGVPHGTLILQLTDALIRGAQQDFESIRSAAIGSMGEQAVIDILTVASAFNGITRVADATGIPLDPNTEQSTEYIRAILDINRFADSK